MTVDSSVFHYFLEAGLVVKMVMLLLVGASFVSWVMIFQRGFFLRWTRRELNTFEKEFWVINDLVGFYNKITKKKEVEGLEKIFMVGFKEFARLKKRTGIKPGEIIEGTQRIMRVARMQETDNLEAHLSFLATVGSISPYVGLFGTVWGIMTAFQALGHVEQATISMVAPGISEALIATAMGLFAAIPAVIAYNRYSNLVERILSSYEAFDDAFSSYLYRQLSGSQAEE